MYNMCIICVFSYNSRYCISYALKLSVALSSYNHLHVMYISYISMISIILYKASC